MSEIFKYTYDDNDSSQFSGAHHECISDSVEIDFKKNQRPVSREEMLYENRQTNEYYESSKNETIVKTYTTDTIQPNKQIEGDNRYIPEPEKEPQYSTPTVSQSKEYAQTESNLD